MGKIGLKGFEPIPEGKYSMKVVKVNHKETFNKVEMTYESAAGKQHTEKFDLNIDGGAWAFSITAKNLLNDNTLDSIDPKDLVGHFALFEVTHETVDYKGRATVFARARSYGSADGFVIDKGEDGEIDLEPVETGKKKPAPAPAPAPAKAEKKSSGLDLDSILGDD